jgi:hypothetical protein
VTLIELFVFMFFVGGGAWAGAGVASLIAPGDRWIGPIVGAAAGGGLLALISLLVSRAHPPCRCGLRRESDFTFVQDVRWGWVERCACGLLYRMDRRHWWFELRPELGEPKLYLRCDFWGRWRA